MSQLLYLNVGENAAQFYSSSATSQANPFLDLFENFPGKNGALFAAVSEATLSVHAVNIPLSVSFNGVAMLINMTSVSSANRTESMRFGLYSMNAGTLSLANSAGASYQFTNGQNGLSWWSMSVSTTQQITPGAWYFAYFREASTSSTNTGANGGIAQYFYNSSINVGNAAPVMVRGRMTASTNAMPATIATSDLDITGADAAKQPYIIIT